jgi:hypothetical protein
MDESSKNEAMPRTLEEAKKRFKVGYIYDLKDFNAPKVWMGEFFECIITDQRIKFDARFDGDYYDKPVHIRDYADHFNALDIYKPERFKELIDGRIK